MTELTERVKKWISESGYPIEMFVAKAFRERGFRTTQAEYYIDLESGDNREIDVVASIQEDVGEFLVRITVCVECKSAKKNPWIVFTSKDRRLTKPATVVQRPASKIGKNFLYKMSQNRAAQNLSLFELEERNGYGLTEAFTTGKDNAYASCISIGKCASSLVKDADDASIEQGPICLIVVPLVLIEGKLFECYQDESELEVNELNKSKLVWRNDVSNVGHSIINIATKDGLSEFIDEVVEMIEFTFSQEGVFSEIESEIISKYKNRWNRPLITRQ